jgi:hypothetical protein
MDRFPQELQVHLELSDISEVTSQRVLRKNSAAEDELGRLFDEHRARLSLNSKLTADITLPELGRQAFMDLYPLLPYQIVLIIDIVSGLRTQGGANRTIIKLAQQLLINPSTRLADKVTGALVRLDHVYDLIEGNIASDIRAKIASVSKRVGHPDAQAVAKVICLLQFVKTVHRTPENIAAALLDRVDGESRLAAVKEALAELEKALMVRHGEGGYRIPTPAEDDWDQKRSGIDLKGADRKRTLSEILSGFWAPQPVFSLGDTKQFRAGLMVNGTEAISGDINFNLQLADDAAEATTIAEEIRRRSQLEQRSVFWVVTLDEDIEREAREAFRSSQIILIKTRGTLTPDETTLIGEEKVRLKRHQDELRRHLRTACLSGQVFFRGNDRSPDPTVTDVGKAAATVLGQALPTVYDRFQEAAAKAPDVRKGLEALLTAANLSGLPNVFAQLGLMRDEKGKPVFRTDVPPLSEALAQIEAKANYGEQATGKYLEDEFAKAPFGWDMEAVRLFAVCLLRAGRVEAVSKGQTIDAATTVQAKECFTNNNLFRAANFRPKKGIDFAVLAEAATHFSNTFGNEVRELSASTLATQLRAEVERHEDLLDRVLATLREARLPGAEILENALSQMRAIRKASDDSAISTFGAGHRSVKDAIHRSAELSKVLTEPALLDIERARAALTRIPALRKESDLDPAVATRGDELAELLRRETFFRDLPKIEQSATAIEAEFRRRLAAALEARVGSHIGALETLCATAGWIRLDPAQQEEISRPLRLGAERDGAPENIAHLRSETEACAGRLAVAIARLHELLEGERLAAVSIAPFFEGGIETEEQLDQALTGVREAFSRLIGEGKKVIVR